MVIKEYLVRYCLFQRAFCFTQNRDKVITGRKKNRSFPGQAVKSALKYIIKQSNNNQFDC